MSFRLFPLVIVWLGLSIQSYAGQPWLLTSARVSQVGTDLLQESQARLRTIHGFAYDGEYVSEGIFASVLPSQKGHVVMVSDSRSLRMRADSWLAAPDGRLVLMSEMICDGEKVAAIGHDRKTYRELTGPGAGGEVLRWHGIVQEQMLRGELYKNELAGKPSYNGVQTIDGIECYEIQCKIPEAPVVTFWFLGKADLLPRRVVRTISSKHLGEGRGEMTLRSLEVNPRVDDSLFVMSRPEGYGEHGSIDIGTHAVRSPLEAEFLPIGSEAPDWTLRTSDGKQVALKDLRGKVVLLSFWASWATPCTNALPTLRALGETYANSAFAACIVDAYEHRADPAKGLRGMEHSPVLLLNGDAVARAYQVSGLPTFYVIGPDGKVLFADGGVLHEESVKEVIDKALNG